MKDSEIILTSIAIALICTTIFATMVLLLGLFPALCVMYFLKTFRFSLKVHKEEQAKDKARRMIRTLRQGEIITGTLKGK